MVVESRGIFIPGARQLRSETSRGRMEGDGARGRTRTCDLRFRGFFRQCSVVALAAAESRGSPSTGTASGAPVISRLAGGIEMRKSRVQVRGQYERRATCSAGRIATHAPLLSPSPPTVAPLRLRTLDGQPRMIDLVRPSGDAASPLPDVAGQGRFQCLPPPCARSAKAVALGNALFHAGHLRLVGRRERMEGIESVV